MRCVQPKAKPSKREAIPLAMLEIVTERSLHEASMSLVMERSGASAGVIYHHFASKEAILEAVLIGCVASKLSVCSRSTHQAWNHARHFCSSASMPTASIAIMRARCASFNKPSVGREPKFNNLSLCRWHPNDRGIHIFTQPVQRRGSSCGLH